MLLVTFNRRNGQKSCAGLLEMQSQDSFDNARLNSRRGNINPSRKIRQKLAYDEAMVELQDEVMVKLQDKTIEIYQDKATKNQDETTKNQDEATKS